MRRCYGKRRLRSVVVMAATAGALQCAAFAGTPASWVHPGGGFWDNPANWSTNPYYPNNDNPPGTTYDATIYSPGTPFTVTLDQHVTLDNLTLQSAKITLSQSELTLTLNNTFALNAATYILSNGTLESGTSAGATLTSTTGYVFIPAGTSSTIKGVNVNSTVSMDPGSQLNVIATNSTMGAGALSLQAGLPVVVGVDAYAFGGTLNSGGATLNGNTALIAQNLGFSVGQPTYPNQFPTLNLQGGIRLVGSNQIGLVADSANISVGVPGINGSSGDTQLTVGGRGIVTFAGGLGGYLGKLNVESGVALSPILGGGLGNTMTLGETADGSNIGVYAPASPSPFTIDPASTGVFAFANNSHLWTGPTAEAGSSYIGAYAGAGTISFRPPPLSPGAGNTYRLGGGGGTLALDLATTGVLHGSNNLVIGYPRSAFGDLPLNGTGTVAIADNSTYTGTTLVNAGSSLTISGTAGIGINAGAVTVDGTLEVSGAIAHNGPITIRRGGLLQIDGNNDGMSDHVPDAMPIVLNGGSLSMQTTANYAENDETAGPVTADGGLATIFTARPAGTQGTIVQLTLASLTRTPGTTLRFYSSEGFLGQSLAGAGHIYIADGGPALQNGIYPWATVTHQGFATAFATYQAGSLHGITAIGPGTAAQIDSAGPTDNIVTTESQNALTADRTINSLNLNYRLQPTLDLGGYTLTLGSGGFINNSATRTIANGSLTAGTNGPAELFMHVPRMFPGDDLPVTITAQITDNPAGAVSLVKDGAASLILNPADPGGNTYSGGTFVNQGTLASYVPLHGAVNVSDATLDLRNDQDQAVMITGQLTTTSAPTGSATLHVGKAVTAPANPASGKPELQVNNLTVSPGSTLTLTSSDNYSLGVIGSMNVQDAVIRSQATDLWYRASGSNYFDDAGTSFANALPGTEGGTIHFASGGSVAVNANLRGVTLSADMSSPQGQPTTLIYNGRLLSDDVPAGLSAGAGSTLQVSPSAVLDTSRGWDGTHYDAQQLTLTTGVGGTIEFMDGFVLMQATGSNTLNDVGAANLLVTGNGTWITHNSANLPNYPALPTGSAPGQYAGLIHLQNASTWSVQTHDQSYNQAVAVEGNVGIDTESNLTFEPSGVLAFVSSNALSSLTKTGPGALTVAGNVSGRGTINVQAGSAIFQSDLGAGGAAITLAAQGGRTTFGASQHLQGLSVAMNAIVDIQNVALSIHYANGADPNAAITASILQGRGGNSGIVSSTAATNEAVGWLDDTTNQTELIKTTIKGDANLDGKVDFADFVDLSSHFGQATDQWSLGDFNGDGVVNFADFILLSENFGTSLSPAQAAEVRAWEQSATRNVPEPTSLALVAFAGLALLRKRRMTLR